MIGFIPLFMITNQKPRLPYIAQLDVLGDLIYEANGKVAGYKVLAAEGPKIEVTITEKGTLKGGIDTTDTVTYWSIPRLGGAYYAEGKGVLMIKEDKKLFLIVIYSLLQILIKLSGFIL